jgi:hypothetical protein
MKKTCAPESCMVAREASGPGGSGLQGPWSQRCRQPHVPRRRRVHSTTYRLLDKPAEGCARRKGSLQGPPPAASCLPPALLAAALHTQRRIACAGACWLPAEGGRAGRVVHSACGSTCAQLSAHVPTRTAACAPKHWSASRRRLSSLSLTSIRYRCIGLGPC